MTTRWRKIVDGLMVKYQMAVEREKDARQQMDEVAKSVEQLQQAQSIVQCIAQAIQQRAHEKIARIVTRSMAVVFDEPYEFRIDFDRKRGKTEARMVFVRDGMELDDPLNEVGGGVIDVASLALRLACVMLSKPPRRRLIVLDEPFSNIRGEENRRRKIGRAHV